MPAVQAAVNIAANAGIRCTRVASVHSSSDLLVAGIAANALTESASQAASNLCIKDMRAPRMMHEEHLHHRTSVHGISDLLGRW